MPPLSPNRAGAGLLKQGNDLLVYTKYRSDFPKREEGISPHFSYPKAMKKSSLHQLAQAALSP